MTQYENALQQGRIFRRKGGTDYTGDFTLELPAFVNAGVAVDTALLSAIAGSKLRILSYLVTNQGGVAATVVFNSKPGGAGVAIGPVMNLGVGGWIAESFVGGLFNSALSEGISVTVTGAAVGVRATYILID